MVVAAGLEEEEVVVHVAGLDGAGAPWLEVAPRCGEVVGHARGDRAWRGLGYSYADCSQVLIWNATYDAGERWAWDATGTEGEASGWPGVVAIEASVRA